MSSSRTRAALPSLFKELNNPGLASALPLIATLNQKDTLSDNDIRQLLHFKNEQGESALHLAALNSCAELVKCLLQLAAPGYINNTNVRGVAALHYAVYGDLISNPSDLKATSEEKQTAKETLRIATVQTLLENQADPNLKSKWGATALRICAGQGFYAIASLLLLHNADANAPDTDGNLPLHIACTNSYKITKENIKLIETLAMATDDINATNSENETPLQIAWNNNRFDILGILLQNGASAAIKSGLFSDSFLKDHAAQSAEYFQSLFQLKYDNKEKALLADALQASGSSTRKTFFQHLMTSFLDLVNQSIVAKIRSQNAEEILTKQTLIGLVISAIPQGEKNKFSEEFAESFFALLKDKKISLADREMLVHLAVNPADVNVGINSLQEKIPLDSYQAKINAAIEAMAKEKAGLYPLHNAIESGLSSTLPALIESQSDDPDTVILNKIRPSDNHSALSLAASKSDWNAVLILVNAGANTTLPKSLFDENLDQNILHYMIQDVSKNKLDRALFATLVSALQAHQHLFALLHEESKAEISPLTAIIKTNEAELVNIVQSQSRDLNAFLLACVKDGTPEILEELHSKIPESKTLNDYKTEEGNNLLHIASSLGLTDQISQLVKLGLSVNQPEPSGNSPVHLAAFAKFTPAIHTLLENGANALATNHANQTFLEILIEGDVNVTALAKEIDKKWFFNPKEPTLTRHLFTQSTKEANPPHEKSLVDALSAIAKRDAEAFYKEFKAESNRLRAESNSGKATPEIKLALLKQHKNLCSLIQKVEPALSSLREVKFHSFMKSPLPEKLKQEQKDLAEKIDVLDRMIHKMEKSRAPSTKRN